MTFTLTEANRLLARSKSGTTGGNTGAVVLDVSAGAVQDAGNVPNPADLNNPVTETGDAIAPAVASGAIDYGTGIMVVTLTEGLTLTTQADGTKFHINNVTGTDVVTLTQAEISGVNQGSRTITFQLTEAHRIAALALSGTAGGNGGAAILDVDLGGLTDPIGNVSVANSDNTTLSETADGTAPTITSATLDYNTGILVVPYRLPFLIM